jgi:peptidyl-prolyl cis-trans isomerase D
MQAVRSFSIKVAAVLFGVLMLLFMVTSVDWSQITGGSKTTVGSINGVSIPFRSYQQMVQQATEQRQRQEGRTLSQEDVEEVRNQVWDQLIQQQALDREYRARRIAVTVDEIADAIKNNPLPEFLQAEQFKTDNKFDPAKYQAWLQSSAAAAVVPALEADYSEQIKRSKLLRVITADVYISDPQLWQTWRDEHEKATIEVTAIVPRTAVPDSAVSLSEAEARAYYTAHADEFKRPGTAYLSYVELLRSPDASDSAAALTRVKALRQEIVDGAPFEEVAKRESADSVSAREGGSLGEFKRGQFDPAFEKAAFSLPIGTVSEPVGSQFGYHLIKVSKRSGDKATAQHILVPIEVTGAHRDRLDARADSLETLAGGKLDGTTLDTLSRVMGITIRQALPAQKGSRVQVGLQVIPDAGVWAFQAKQGETSRIIEVSYAYFLFRLDSLRAEGVPPFEAIKGSVEIAARNSKKREQARVIAQDLERRIKEGSTLTQAATALNLPHQELGPFSRINPPFPSAEVVGAAFGVPVGSTSDVLDTDEGIYLVRVTKRDPADSAAFLKGIDDYRLAQLRLARQERVRNYLTALKDNAKVTDRRAQLYTTDAQAEAATTAKKS